jgi:opacity protein-like surface antigen
MAGPQYSFVHDKFTLDLRAEAGIIKSTSTPSFIILFDNSTTTTDAIEQHSSQGKAFAYGGSAGLRYSFTDNWDIGLKANYINSSGIAISNANNPGTTGRFVTKQPISELQTTLGITFKF